MICDECTNRVDKECYGHPTNVDSCGGFFNVPFDDDRRKPWSKCCGVKLRLHSDHGHVFSVCTKCHTIQSSLTAHEFLKRIEKFIYDDGERIDV